METDLLKLIAQGGAGVIAAFVAIAISGVGEKPRWVFGNYYRERMADLREEQRRRDEVHAEIVQRLNVDLANMRSERNDWQEAWRRTIPVAETAVRHVAAKAREG